MAMASRKSLWLAALALAFSASAGAGHAGESDRAHADRVQ
ncbi:DUF1223 domain-containing protein, partial [Mesorhizobium sp. M7A.T.Ca.TU.009.01.1.1]